MTSPAVAPSDIPLSQLGVEIEKAYIAFFNRDADGSGMAFWLYQHPTDAYGYMDMQGLMQAFAQSDEYLSNFAGLTHTQVVDRLYHNLFDRAPDQEGLAYWVNLMDAGYLTTANAAYAIMNGAQGSDAWAIGDKAVNAQAKLQAILADLFDPMPPFDPQPVPTADAQGTSQLIGYVDPGHFDTGSHLV
ncbi:MAG: DUF4214 domain-containing protein [Desulfobulbus sp.]|nr:DUF4214 domain-containing protein [Desulfobulbus sp.]